MTDQKIIEELKNGNMKAFHYLYTYFPMVKKLVLRNSGTEEDAKDLFQNALIVFFHRIKQPEFELTSKIATYLYAVCDKNWKKQLTRDPHRHHRSVEQVAELPDNRSAEEPEKPLREYVAELLDQLGDPCRSIILYHQFYRMRMEVIAEKMGYANAHTVRNQKYKCLQKLRKMIPEAVRKEYMDI